MITHGRQQILPPNMIIGRTQIQGACIGIERIVGLWLGWQAVQAIVNAFGQRDGMAVIKATNAYLNQLAASDRDKATALAGFINEDPMMVCSLGLEVEGVTMPKREMISDGNIYVVTDIKPARNLTTHLEIKIATPSTSYSHRNIFGIYNYSSGWRRDTYFLKFNTLSSSSHRICCAMSASTNTAQLDQEINIPLDTYIKIDITPTKYIVNGTNSNSYTIPQEFDQTYPLTLFGITAFTNGRSSSSGCVMGLRPCIMEQDGQEVARIVPFNGRTLGYGMVDVVRAKFFPVQGTGTPTIPDISYTPSTP